MNPKKNVNKLMKMHVGIISTLILYFFKTKKKREETSFNSAKYLSSIQSEKCEKNKLIICTRGFE